MVTTTWHHWPPQTAWKMVSPLVQQNLVWLPIRNTLFNLTIDIIGSFFQWNQRDFFFYSNSFPFSYFFHSIFKHFKSSVIFSLNFKKNYFFQKIDKKFFEKTFKRRVTKSHFEFVKGRKIVFPTKISFKTWWQKCFSSYYVKLSMNYVLKLPYNKHYFSKPNQIRVLTQQKRYETL